MQNMKEMSVRAIKSSIITVKDNLLEVLSQTFQASIQTGRRTVKTSRIHEGDILVITSKVVAVTQGRVITVNNQNEFDALVKRESNKLIGGKKVTLTLKNGIFTPWAGIDRSNTKKGTAVLWPKNPQKVATDVRAWLKKTYKLRKIGVIIVDSFCAPLRKGVIGIALAHSGFEGVRDKRGTKDLYGNSLKFTQEAIADSLATMANLAMGQGNEQTPFAIISGAPVQFTNKKPASLLMPTKDCLYGELYHFNRRVKK